MGINPIGGRRLIPYIPSGPKIPDELPGGGIPSLPQPPQTPTEETIKKLYENLNVDYSHNFTEDPTEDPLKSIYENLNNDYSDSFPKNFWDGYNEKINKKFRW